MITNFIKLKYAQTHLEHLNKKKEKLAKSALKTKEDVFVINRTLKLRKILKASKALNVDILADNKVIAELSDEQLFNKANKWLYEKSGAKYKDPAEVNKIAVEQDQKEKVKATQKEEKKQQKQQKDEETKRKKEEQSHEQVAKKTNVNANLNDVPDIENDLYQYISEVANEEDADKLLEIITKPQSQNTDEITRLSEVNTAILSELKSIREDIIDEQDTSVKKTSQSEDEIDQLLTNNNNNNEDKDDITNKGSLWSTLGALLLSYLPKDFKKMFKNFKKTFKGGLKGMVGRMLPHIIKSIFGVAVVAGSFSVGLWVGDQISKFFGIESISESIQRQGLQSFVDNAIKGILITIPVLKTFLEKTNIIKPDVRKKKNKKEREFVGRDVSNQFRGKLSDDDFDDFEDEMEKRGLVNWSWMGHQFGNNFLTKDGNAAVRTFTSPQIKHLMKKNWPISADQSALDKGLKRALAREKGAGAGESYKEELIRLSSNKPKSIKGQTIPAVESETNYVTNKHNTYVNNNMVSTSAPKYSTNATTNIKKIFNFDKGNINVDGLNSNVKANLSSLGQEYFDETGKRMQINSGYRSILDQEKLYRQNPKKAAKPGSSMHNYGYAIDLNSSELNEADSMGLLNKYGFHRPAYTKEGKHETWHLEPKGIDKKAIRMSKVNKIPKVNLESQPAVITPKVESEVPEVNKESKESKVQQVNTNLLSNTKSYNSNQNVQQTQPVVQQQVAINSSKDDNTNLMALFSEPKI